MGYDLDVCFFSELFSGPVVKLGLASVNVRYIMLQSFCAFSNISI